MTGDDAEMSRGGCCIGDQLIDEVRCTGLSSAQKMVYDEQLPHKIAHLRQPP